MQHQLILLFTYNIIIIAIVTFISDDRLKGYNILYQYTRLTDIEDMVYIYYS